MTTKKLISDQTLFRIAGGAPDSSYQVDERDIWKALEQLINAALKLSQFNQNLPSGETLPENLQIGIYENITVTSSPNGVGKSYSTLPTMPISLPRNMGIYQIYNADYPDSPFIPIQAGQRALLKTDALLSDLLGQVSYEPKGKTIFFSKDLPLYDVTTVTMELVCMDMSLYGVNDVLPLPADLEAGIIEQLVKMFSAVVPEIAEVNPYTSANQQLITNPKAK
jgi:hypothetical protein